MGLTCFLLLTLLTYFPPPFLWLSLPPASLALPFHHVTSLLCFSLLDPSPTFPTSCPAPTQKHKGEFEVQRLWLPAE